MHTPSQRLKEDLNLQRPFESLDEEALLALVLTNTHLTKVGYAFFSHYGLTDVQFNILMILWDFKDRPLKQYELAELLVINRASLGAVLDTLTGKNLVIRQNDPKDRRAKIISLTPKGKTLLKKVKPTYYQHTHKLFGHLTDTHKKQLVSLLDQLRTLLKAHGQTKAAS